MNTRTRVIFFGLCAVIAAAGTYLFLRMRGPDLSTPRNALIAYTVATKMGDARELGLSSFGLDEDYINSYATMTSAYRHLHEVAAKQFADSTAEKPQTPKTREYTLKLATVLVEGYDDPAIDGDTATFKPSSKHTITLKLMNGKWRVDAMNDINASYFTLKWNTKEQLREATFANETADEIAANKYHVWSEANNALNKKIAMALRNDPDYTAVTATHPGAQKILTPGLAKQMPKAHPAAVPPATSPETADKLRQIASRWQSSNDRSTDITASLVLKNVANEDGNLHLLNAASLKTTNSFQTPVTFHIIAYTNLKDFRIKYAANQIIFNWEMNHSQLRVDGGPTAGKHKAGAGLLPANEWVGMELIFKTDAMIINIDGVERYNVPGDFSKINQPFSLEAHSGDVWIKSIAMVRP